jgi:hypothetical protein
MISLSKGFMMYSSAPALIASWICSRSFLVVQKTTLGFSHLITAIYGDLAVFRLNDVKLQFFHDFASNHSNNP